MSFANDMEYIMRKVIFEDVEAMSNFIIRLARLTDCSPKQIKLWQIKRPSNDGLNYGRAYFHFLKGTLMTSQVSIIAEPFFEKNFNIQEEYNALR